jgi:hypothetical protein
VLLLNEARFSIFKILLELLALGFSAGLKLAVDVMLIAALVLLTGLTLLFGVEVKFITFIDCLLVFTLPSKLVGCAEKEGLVVVTYALF